MTPAADEKLDQIAASNRAQPDARLVAAEMDLEEPLYITAQIARIPHLRNPMATKPQKDERDALNCHGVFLKKRVLEEIRKTPRMGIFAEEFGVAFGEPVAIDVIGVDTRDDRQLLFVFECKRAYAQEKTWVFFEDIDPTFRLFRVVSRMQQFGYYRNAREMPIAGGAPVCSEGYEMVASDKGFRAD